MLIAGEASGDLNAAELVRALAELAPGSQFFGAGGPQMARAGVELAFDMTKQSSIGLDFLVKLPAFWRMFRDLVNLAAQRRPEVIVLVDFAGFNRRFAAAIRKRIRSCPDALRGWQPKIVQYVSPQVWASRPGRAAKMAQVIDLLLCLFPFEKEWYARRAPQLPIECVGHPIFDRHDKLQRPPREPAGSGAPLVALLPGSRSAELRRHLPVLLGAARLIAQKLPARFEMILPNEALALKAREAGAADVPGLQIKVGGLDETLSRATIALTKTGTITLECAYFGVPAIAIYKTSWITYQIGRLIVTVPYLTMPNLLAGRAVFPEFVQGDATAENLAREALALLGGEDRRREAAAELDKIMKSLGGSGAAQRAAQAILQGMKAEG